MHCLPSVHIASIKKTDFCKKPVQAAKETASGSLMKNQCGYKNNQLVAY